MSKTEMPIKKEFESDFFLACNEVLAFMEGTDHLNPMAVVSAMITLASVQAFAEAPSIASAKNTIENCVRLAFHEYTRL